MDNGSGLSASDVLALTRNNDNSDFMGGASFWWVIVFLIVAGMFNGNGFGFGNNGLANDTLLSDEFIKRDIFNTNQNVSNTANSTQRQICDTNQNISDTANWTQKDVLNTRYDLGTNILENRYTTQLGLQNLQAQNQACCCETQKEILESRYNNSLGQAGLQKDIMQNRYDNLIGQSNLQKDMLLGNKDFQAQLAECCCDLKTAIHSEAEATRQQMQNDKIEELRASLNTATNAYTSLQLANNIVGQIRPTPVPAYITCSPYQAVNTCGCGNNAYGYNYGVSNVI